MKQSSISYYKFDDKFNCIIASLPNRKDVQVIYIDKICGTLLFSGIKGYDVFDDKDSAYKFISQDRKLVQRVNAHSILGYVFSINSCILILIDKEKPLFPLFDKHMINSIEHVVFIEIPIEIRSPDACGINIDLLNKYPFHHGHYYSPTLDLSKDFGSRTNTVRNCWNQKLMQPFKRFSSFIPNLCVAVFQGIASYTPFVEINIGIMFLSSRLFPPLFTKSGKHYASETGITGNEYTIDVYLIKAIENDFQVLNHTIQVGDFPFNWSSDQNSIKNIIENEKENKKFVKAYIQRQKALYNYNYITFVNFMRRDGIENALYEALDTALNDLGTLPTEFNNFNYEQDGVEWIQSVSETNVLDDLVQNYWPTASAKIKKYGFTKSLVTINNQISTSDISNEEHPYKCQTQSRQKGVCRILFDFSFDREILGLFFYTMKLLEIMCLDEFGLNFPEKLVVPFQINTFLKGFVIFTAKFLLEFNLFLSNFGNLPIGDLEKLIYEYINLSTVDFEPYSINYQSYTEVTNILKNITVPSVFAVTQSPSSFIMNKTISNRILRPSNTIQVEISKDSQPLIICLSEPCYIKSILLRNTNAIQASILAGLRLNRTIKIASKIVLPWIAKTDTKTVDPYVCIDLDTRSTLYDGELRPHDFEKVRFLLVKLRAPAGDAVRLGGIYAFGSDVGVPVVAKKIGVANLPLGEGSPRRASSDSLDVKSPKIHRERSEPASKRSNTQTTQKVQTQQTTQKVQNQQITQKVQSQQTTQKVQAQQITQKVQAQQITQKVQAQQITQKVQAQQITQKVQSQQITQKVQNQQKAQNMQNQQQNAQNFKNFQQNQQGSQKVQNSQTLQKVPSNQKIQQLPKSRAETIIISERNRLMKREPYAELQKLLVSRNVNLDSYDLEKVLNPSKSERELRKATCARCQTKDVCSDCASCKRVFCRRCSRTLIFEGKEISFCEDCWSRRQQCIAEVDKLRALQLDVIKERYPFIAWHSEQLAVSLTKPALYLTFELPATVSPTANLSGFSDINRPFLATFAYEPPIPQKMLNRLPECLFTSNVNFLFESTLVPLTIIFTSKSRVVAVHVSCLTRLEMEVEGASPSHLTFEPPGSIQKVELVGRLVNVVLSGSKIELRNIRFFGTPVFQKVENKNKPNQAPTPAPKQRNLAKVQPLSSQFSKELNAHEFAFNNNYNFVGFVFSKAIWLPREIVVEFRTEKAVEYASLSVARVFTSQADGQMSAVVQFPKPFAASKVRAFYPKLNAFLTNVYATETPDLIVLQKLKAKK